MKEEERVEMSSRTRSGTLSGPAHTVAGAGEAPWSGFSLVEASVVLAVLGVLSLVATVRFQGWTPAARVERAARELGALLEWARWQAVAQGCRFRVEFDSAGGSAVVIREDAAGGEEVEVKRLDLRQSFPGVVFGSAPCTYRTSGCSYVQPSGVHLVDDAVRFLPHGTTDRCGSIYLIPGQDVPDRQDRTRALSLLLSTGRIQLWKYDPLGIGDCPHCGVWVPLY